MPRNTNIDALLFEVKKLPVFVKGRAKSIPGYKAVAGFFKKGNYSRPTVFAFVSASYMLLPKEEALRLGKLLHGKLFPGATSSSFQVFNVHAPLTRSFCHIDIIDSNYEVNIMKKEVYLPFIRVQNSYNRYSALRFDIGFCRKLCDNGVIFEQNTIRLEFKHTRELENVKQMMHVRKDHLQDMVDDFRQKVLFSTQLVMPAIYFIPMTARIFGKVFDLNNPNPYEKHKAYRKLNDFTLLIEALRDKYLPEFGETAYTFYNMITDYASNLKHPPTSVNSMQWRCGSWLRNLEQDTKQPDFSWRNELRDYQYMLPVEPESTDDKEF